MNVKARTYDQFRLTSGATGRVDVRREGDDVRISLRTEEGRKPAEGARVEVSVSGGTTQVGGGVDFDRMATLQGEFRGGVAELSIEASRLKELAKITGGAFPEVSYDSLQPGKYFEPGYVGGISFESRYGEPSVKIPLS